jgi:hypothetical protein
MVRCLHQRDSQLAADTLSADCPDNMPIVRGQLVFPADDAGNGSGMRFPVVAARWHGLCSLTLESFIPQPRRTIMKFETLMLQTLFSACLLVCLLAMGAMLTTRVNVSKVADGHVPVAAATN